MTEYPKISVVTITYAHEKYITQTLEGVLMQDYPGEIEFIIANDNSPDNTHLIIEEYFSQINIPNNFIIKYTNHETNKGMMPNFFWALEQAEGKYIAMCEGDDYWIDSLKLQKQVNFLEVNREFGLIATDFNIWHQSNERMEKSLFRTQASRFPIYSSFEDFLAAAGYMAPCTWLLRKEYLPVFNKEYVDGTFPWLLDIYALSKVYVLSDTTTVYRYLIESASHSISFDKRYKLSKGILKIQLDYITKYDLSETFKLKVLKKHYQLLLPTLVALELEEEIKNALIYIPKNQRSIKDTILFIISKIPLTKNFIRMLYNFKGIKA